MPARGYRPSAAGAPGQPWAATVGGSALFRREALEAHAQGRVAEGTTVRLGAPWLRWYFRLTLALIVVGVTAVALVPVRQSSYAPAIADFRGGRFAALFPAAAAPELAAARDLDFGLPGGAMRPVQISGLRMKLASAAAAVEAGFRPTDQPSVLVTGQLAIAPPVPDGPVRSQAVLVLPARSLASVLAHELKVMLGAGGAAL